MHREHHSRGPKPLSGWDSLVKTVLPDSFSEIKNLPAGEYLLSGFIPEAGCMCGLLKSSLTPSSLRIRL